MTSVNYKCNPTTWRGHDFPSQAELARFLNVSEETIGRRLNAGTLEDLNPKQSKIKTPPLAVWVDGTWFKTATAAAQHIGISRALLAFHISRARAWNRNWALLTSGHKVIWDKTLNPQEINWEPRLNGNAGHRALKKIRLERARNAAAI